MSVTPSPMPQRRCEFLSTARLRQWLPLAAFASLPLDQGAGLLAGWPAVGVPVEQLDSFAELAPEQRDSGLGHAVQVVESLVVVTG